MKSIGNLLTEWRSSNIQMKRITDSLPRIIGNIGVRTVKENFKLQGYDSGFGVKAWEPRKDSTNKSYDRRSGVKGSVYNSQSPILEQTRNLYNSIKYEIASKSVTIGVELSLVPYGEKMNEGGPGKWGKNPTFTPARKYMPTPGEEPNPKMIRRIERKVLSEVQDAFSQFKK